MQHIIDLLILKNIIKKDPISHEKFEQYRLSYRTYRLDMINSFEYLILDTQDSIIYSDINLKYIKDFNFVRYTVYECNKKLSYKMNESILITFGADVNIVKSSFLTKIYKFILENYDNVDADTDKSEFIVINCNKDALCLHAYTTPNPTKSEYTNYYHPIESLFIGNALNHDGEDIGSVDNINDNEYKDCVNDHMIHVLIQLISAGNYI